MDEKEELLFLVKIGKKEHLQDIIEGQLYCSPAERYIKQEREQHEKGQGDLLEGKWIIHNEGGVAECEDGRSYIIPKSTITVSIDGVQSMPVFCMTKGGKKDCSFYKNENEYIICFSEEYKNEVHNSFKDADSALIILEPYKFMNKLTDTIGKSIKHGEIRYFDYSINDIRMMSFLVGANGIASGNAYVQTAEGKYRHLLCKDIAFSEQKEYRLILENESIRNAKKYPFQFESKYMMVKLEELFGGIEISMR